MPLTVRGLPTYKAQHWLNRIHDELKGTVMRRTPPECMAKFVGKSLKSYIYVLSIKTDMSEQTYRP